MVSPTRKILPVRFVGKFFFIYFTKFKSFTWRGERGTGSLSKITTASWSSSSGSGFKAEETCPKKDETLRFTVDAVESGSSN